MSYMIQELCDEIKKLKQALAEKDKSYQQLMEKTVRFAKAMTCEDDPGIAAYIAASDFLQSPEVQAWKEHKP